MIDGNDRRLKFVFAIIIILFFSFIYSSFFYKVKADEEENITSNILESQSKSLRDIKFYRRSK